MFQLTSPEYESLRSQIVILDAGRGRHRKYLPLVFTEQGVAMLSSVLNSERAAQVNIAIVRTFVKLREMLTTQKDLAGKIERLERKYEGHDQQLKAVFDAIRQLIAPPTAAKRRKIGFHQGD